MRSLPLLLVAALTCWTARADAQAISVGVHEMDLYKEATGVDVRLVAMIPKLHRAFRPFEGYQLRDSYRFTLEPSHQWTVPLERFDFSITYLRRSGPPHLLRLRNRRHGRTTMDTKLSVSPGSVFYVAIGHAEDEQLRVLCISIDDVVAASPPPESPPRRQIRSRRSYWPLVLPLSTLLLACLALLATRRRY